MRSFLLRSGSVLALLAAVAPPSLAIAFGEVEVPSVLQALSRQWTSEAINPEPESSAFLRSRDSLEERLSLAEAVTTAIENNPGIAAERLGPIRARNTVRGNWGIFDPEIRLYADVSREVRPTGTALAGAVTSRKTDRNFGISIAKLIRTGARLELAFENSEVQDNSEFVGLRPQYQPDLRFSITQPLLRNFGPGITILLLRSAELESEESYYQYQTQVTDLVEEVIAAYWGIVLAARDLDAETEGLELARVLEWENQARVEAGVLPPIAVREAAAEAARREERVIVAENALAISTDRLQLLVHRNPNRTFLPRRIRPTETPKVGPVETPELSLIKAAIAQRPDVLRLRSEIAGAHLKVRARRNELLPSLDLEASYGHNGLSGRALPQIDFRTGEQVRSRFGGNYGKSLDRLTSGDFESYSAGVTLSFPLGNEAAAAEYVGSRIDLRRTELRYRQLLSDVALEIRRSIGDVRSTSKRVTASRLARELAEETLGQQKERLDAGLATTRDVLDTQEKLTAARAAEIRALIEYKLARADLAAATGSLLDQFDILLERLPPAEPRPWARL